MGRLLTILVLLAIFAGPLCGMVLAQTTAPAVTASNYIYLPPGKDPRACLKKADGIGWGAHLGTGLQTLKLRACNYPSLTPCADKDRDGWFACSVNERVPLYEWWQVKGLRDPQAGYDFTVVQDNPYPLMPFPDYLVMGEPCTYFPTYTLCKVHSWGDDQDCDDASPTIAHADFPSNSAPIQSIVSVERDPDYVKEAREQRNVYLANPEFNPFDPLIVTIKASPCVSNLEAKVTLNIGHRPPIALGTAYFSQNKSREKGILTGKLDNLFDLSAGVINPAMPDEYSLTRISEKLRRVLTAFMATAGMKGEGLTTLSFTTKDGTVSVPIALTLCVDLYGRGDRVINVIRPVNLENSVTYSGKELEREPLLSQTENTLRPLRFGVAIYQNLRDVDFLQNVIDRFTIRADLSLFREEFMNENWNPQKWIPRSCGGKGTNVLESAENQRAFADRLGRLIVMGPTIFLYSASARSLSGEYMDTVLHELGHDLGELVDEYDHTMDFDRMTAGQESRLKSWGLSRNCASSEVIGARFPPPQNIPNNDRAVCSWKGVYRSTIESVMNNQHRERRFNVVSCAFILAELLGGNAKKYIYLCEKYDTVKK